MPLLLLQVNQLVMFLISLIFVLSTRCQKIAKNAPLKFPTAKVDLFQ